MDVTELLSGLDAEIAKTEEWIADLLAEVSEAQQRVSDLRLEAKYVRSAYQRIHGTPTAEAGSDASWLALSGVDAVERALQESGPLFLQEIADLLAEKGRPRQRAEEISANLTHLGRKRGTVANVGRGRWDYLSRAVPLKMIEGGIAG